MSRAKSFGIRSWLRLQNVHSLGGSFQHLGADEVCPPVAWHSTFLSAAVRVDTPLSATSKQRGCSKTQHALPIGEPFTPPQTYRLALVPARSASDCSDGIIAYGEIHNALPASHWQSSSRLAQGSSESVRPRTFCKRSEQRNAEVRPCL